MLSLSCGEHEVKTVHDSHSSAYGARQKGGLEAGRKPKARHRVTASSKAFAYK
jgi:hypothetical protein